jgi:hypothetical protein
VAGVELNALLLSKHSVAKLPGPAEPPALGAAGSSAEPAAAAAPPEKENPS